MLDFEFQGVGLCAVRFPDAEPWLQISVLLMILSIISLNGNLAVSI